LAQILKIRPLYVLVYELLSKYKYENISHGKTSLFFLKMS